MKPHSLWDSDALNVTALLDLAALAGPQGFSTSGTWGPSGTFLDSDALGLAALEEPQDFATSGGKWGPSGTFGTFGGTVTWSIAGAGWSNVTGQSFFTGTTVAFSSIMPGDFEAQIAAAFGEWAAVANINFVEVADGGGNFGSGTVANIRIGAGFIDGPNNTIGRGFFPPFGGTANASATNGDIVFDSSESWDSQLLHDVALHEIGHALGLSHSPQDNPTAVMNPTIHLGLPLQPDDIAGIRSIYGIPNIVAINDVVVTEGNAGTKLATFTVTRTGGSGAFAVNFTTVNGNASAGSDYVATGGILNFGTGINTQTVSVTVNGDTAIEFNETFFVNLSNATNGTTIGDGSGRGTIQTDDLPLIKEVSNDFNGDFRSDILWRHAGGQFAEWQMNGAQIAANLGIAAPGNEWHFQDTGDFGGNNRSDVLLRHDNGQVVLWQMDGDQIVSNTAIVNVSNQYQVQGVGDFGYDGKSDVLWRHDNGQVVLWQMNGDQIAQNTSIAFVSNDYQIRGIGDLGGNGTSDIIWRHNSGQVVLWQMNGDQIVSNTAMGIISNEYQIAGIGDFGGDGRADVLWRHASGQVVVWQMNGDQIISNTAMGIISNEYHIEDVRDFNNDGRSDILWRHDSGQVVLWQMNGDQIISNTAIAVVGNEWEIQHHHFDLV